MSEERLNRIKKRGFGILIYFVENGESTFISESLNDIDVFCLQRKALMAVSEMGSQEMAWKMARDKGLV